jgi:hypothetical protein
MDLQRSSPSSSPSIPTGLSKRPVPTERPASGHGEVTGPNSFSLTFSVLSLTEDEGSFAMTTIRAAGEVSEDGQGFTAEFTIELTGEGAPAGEYGPGSVTGTRINVEPMGTPAGPLEALFPDLFPPEEGTAPAGTAPLETSPAGTTPTATEPAGTTPTATEPVGTTPGDTAVATTTGDTAVATSAG